MSGQQLKTPEQTQIEPQQSGIQLRHPENKPISDESLSEYGKMLKFDDKYLKKANEVCQKVLDSLKTGETKPERFSVSESHVCQEGVEDTGIDIVAFMKDNQSLNKVKSVISESLNRLGARNVSTDDKDVVHFDLDNVRVNLGFSESKGPTVGEHRKMVFQQTSRRDKEGKLHKDQIEKVSVDLHDSMTDFLKDKQKDEFDRAAMRLARAWRRTALAPFGDWFSPLDSMLVMQNVLNRERARGARQVGMESVMRQFLNDLANVENMSLTFPDMSLYDWDVVPQWIQQERPLLLDPVNPFRNVFSGIERGMFQSMQRQAQQALKIMEKESSQLKELFNVPPEAESRGA
jgi:hypothetical protein